MNKLIEAAKAVIDEWDSNALFLTPSITKLRAAIERAEKPPAGFEEWADNNNLSEYGKACSRKAWQDAQYAERKRIRAIIKAVRVQGAWSLWFDACDRIMERVDAATK